MSDKITIISLMLLSDSFTVCDKITIILITWLYDCRTVDMLDTLDRLDMLDTFINSLRVF